MSLGSNDMTPGEIRNPSSTFGVLHDIIVRARRQQRCV